MRNDTDRERDYIKIIIQKISAELKLNDPENWQQCDFESLSLLIEEKTGISLSVSTLKRITKNQFQHIPQKNTLNALARFLDYKDWYDFKLSNPVLENHRPRKSPAKQSFKLNKNIFYIPVVALIGITVLLLIFNS